MFNELYGCKLVMDNISKLCGGRRYSEAAGRANDAGSEYN